MTNNNEKTELSQLGEFGLIKQLTQKFSNSSNSTVFGVGDDCAVMAKNDTHFTLVSKDLFIEGIHFNLMYVPLKHLGFKVVSATVSDVYAMNGIPEQILIGLGVSSRFPLEAIEELYEGIRLACEFYNIDLVGGDTASSAQGLFISATALGSVGKDQVSYRSGAKEGDILVVSGDLGSAYLGLQILERERSVFLANPQIQPELDGYEYLIKRQLKPEARKDIVETLALLGIVPTSIIDLSDGLASEVIHLSASSGLGCIIHEEKIPFHEATLLTATELNLHPVTCAMNGGEDYELLFSLTPADYLKIQSNPLFTPVGYFTETKGAFYLMDKHGIATEITAQGFTHF